MSKGPERKEEDRYVTEAAKIGCWAVKFKHEGIKGAPDRIVFLPNGGRPIFIEFKRPDGKGEVSPHQKDFMELLQKFGYACFVCETWQEALKITRDLL